MSRPEMKTDESHASYVPTASPFDAYSFPVSSPSEADLEPVAPPPQEAADGAEVCEAKSFLQQLLAGRTTTPNSAAPRRGDSDGIWSPLTTGLISSGLGFLAMSRMTESGRTSSERLNSLIELEQNILPEVPARFSALFERAYNAALDAASLATELRKSPALGKNTFGYKVAAQRIASLYDASLDILEKMSEKNLNALLNIQSRHPFQLYLTSLQGSARAYLFDLQSPDSLELTTDNRDDLSSFRDRLARPLGSKRAGELMSDFDIYELSRMQAAIERGLGYFPAAAASARRAMDHVYPEPEGAAMSSHPFPFPGVENVLQLWLEALRQIPNADEAVLLRKHFEAFGIFDKATEVSLLRIEALREENPQLRSIHPLEEISLELVELAKLTEELPPPDRPLLIDTISTWINWLEDEEKKGENRESCSVARTAWQIAQVLEKNGDLGNAAILWNRSAQLSAADRLPETASKAQRKVLKILRQLATENAAEGDKAPGSDTAAKPLSSEPLLSEDLVNRVAKDLSPYLDGISFSRQIDIVYAVAKTVGNNGSLSGIIENGHLTSGGMRLVLAAIGVTTSGTAGPSSVARAEGPEKGKKGGRKPGEEDVVKGGKHGR